MIGKEKGKEGKWDRKGREGVTNFVQKILNCYIIPKINTFK